MCLKILLGFSCLAFIALLKEAGCEIQIPEFDAENFIKEKGYVPQTYPLNINDSYEIFVHRILYKEGHEDLERNVTKTPVFLMHGFLASSDFFLLNEGENLPILLADRGFDVWMGNVKGNKYGRSSLKENDPNETKFWDFSWHDLAMNDLATQLDFVREITGLKMHFVGHSMGTTMLLALLSKKPEYNELIEKSFLMSPMAFMGNIRSEMFTPFHILFHKNNNLENLIGQGEFLPRGSKFQNALRNVDRKCVLIGNLKCDDPEYLLTGKSPKLYSETVQNVLYYQFEGGTSVKTFIHYGQIYASDSFREFDYGREENLKMYGTPNPPNYNLHNVKTPLYSFVGLQDELATLPDYIKFHNSVNPSLRQTLRLKLDFYHMDYLFSKDAVIYVYYKILNFITSKE